MNDPSQFHTENRAVSSVIATILLVAIVVIIGTIIAGVALGVTFNIPSPAPQASFDFTPDYETGDIIVTKTAGKTINGNQLKFSGAALEKTTYGSITEWAGKDIQSGRSAAVDVKPSETLRLIWQSPDGRTEAILREYDVPSSVAPTASVGSVTAGKTWVEISTIQFSAVNGRDVTVVVTKRVGSGTAVTTVYDASFSTNGGDLNVTGLQEPGPRRVVEYTVRVYETSDKSIELATDSATYSPSGGGPTRPSR